MYLFRNNYPIKKYKEALSHLSEKKNKVSSHFFINKSGEIFYLVDVMNRAWHAGRSYWKGIIDINSDGAIIIKVNIKILILLLILVDE